MPIHGYPGGVISATPPSVTVNGASGVFTTEQQMQYQTAGNWPMAATQISRSLRFNSADSAYLDRTPASAGNRKTWTWSAWVKKSTLGAYQTLFGQGTGNVNVGYGFIRFDNTDTFTITASPDGATSSIGWTSTPVYRDPSAWYHVVAVLDTTQATAANRFVLYINGVSQAGSFSTTPTQNADIQINRASAHQIGAQNASSLGNYLSSYLADVYFIDGQALTPASFGQTNSATGVWEPRQYTGPYGTNGFYLNFSDNSGTTSTTLGKDYSGNGNNWTPNNFSVTAGAGNDSLVDTPTPYGTDTGAGGEVRGNYNTLSPLTTTNGTYTQGNLRFTGPSAWKRSNGTIAVSTGKWYWEVTLAANPEGSGSGNAYQAFGFGLSTVFNSTSGPDTQTDALVLADNNYYKNFSGSWTSNSTSFASGDVLSIAVDLDANTFTFRKNNSQLVTGTIGGTAGRELVPIIISYSGAFGVMDCNFGQRPFAYTAPSGFKALCTQNLPTPTIGATATTRADDYFNTVLWTGNGASSRSITGVGFQPDFVWYKARSVAYNNGLFDVVRGVSKFISSNLTDAESTISGVSSFDSDGFTLGSDAGGNANNVTMVAWNWKANGTGVSNTAGSITSTVSANQTAGFSIVTYTGNGTTGATVGHGLGVKPSMMIFKGRTNSVDWVVYHTSLGATKNLKLNLTDAEATQSGQFNDTEPTSTLFTLGANNPVNANTVTYVAYCFAAVAGYSAFGSYTANASTDGPFIYTGFRPRWIMAKSSSNTSSWVIYDSVRNTYNVIGKSLYANLSDSEYDTPPRIDFLSNGFKLRSTGEPNSYTYTFVYACFAEFPFKYTLAR